MVGVRTSVERRGVKWRERIRYCEVEYHLGIFGSRESAEASAKEEARRVADGTSALIQPGLVTVDAFADSIGVRKGTVKRWIHEGMPVDRVGAHVRVRPEIAKSWVDHNHGGSIAIRRRSSVYVAQRASDGAIKIGWSADVERRLRELHKGLGDSVALVAMLPGDKPDELRLHQAFADRRLEGEWFAVPVHEVVNAMKDVA